MKVSLLPNLLADRAAATPDRVFLQHVNGAECTFGELDQTVLRWAAALASLGVRRGDTLLVMLDNSFESAITWLAAARLGGIEVQVNTAYLGVILTHVTNNSRATVAVIGSRFVSRFTDVASDLEHLDTLVLVGDDDIAAPFSIVSAADLLSAEHPAPDLVRPSASDTACILYPLARPVPPKEWSFRGLRRTPQRQVPSPWKGWARMTRGTRHIPCST